MEEGNSTVKAWNNVAYHESVNLSYGYMISNKVIIKKPSISHLYHDESLHTNVTH